MKQIPVFIPRDCIERIGPAETTPYRSGQMEIKPKRGVQLKGYSCDGLTAEYMWSQNGKCKGFSQVLDFCFEGRISHFNYLMQTVQNNDSRFVVLLPRGDTYVVIGGDYGELEMAEKSCAYDQTFAMYYQHAVAPFPFLDDEVITVDCSVVELIDALYGTRD